MPLLTYENVLLIDCAEEAIKQMAAEVQAGCAPALAAARALTKLQDLLALDHIEELRYLLDEKMVRIRAALVLAQKYYARPTVIKAIGSQAAKKLRDDYSKLLATVKAN